MTKIARVSIDKNIGKADPLMIAFTGISDTFSSNDMSDFLAANEDADEIHVDINTDGGSVPEGFAIHDLLVNSKKKVTTRALKANSIGTVIFLAGTERNITKNAQFFIHNPRVDAYGTMTASDAQALADDLLECQTKMMDFYSSSLNLSTEQISELENLMAKETDLGSDGALKYGFATAIINGEATAKFTQIVWSEKIAAHYKNNSHNNSKNMITKEEFTASVSKSEKIMNAIAKFLKMEITDGGEVKPVEKDVKATETKLKSGESIFCDGAIGDGVKCFSDEAMTEPAKDGDYTSEDGDSFTITDGVITSFTDADETAEMDKMKEENAKLKEEANKVKAETEDLKAQFVALVKEVTKMKAFVPGAGEHKMKVVEFEKLSPAQQAIANKQKFNALKS